MGGGGGFGGGQGDFGDIFGDVFGDIFGGGRRGGGQQRAQRGSDLRYNMELTLEEAVRGVSKLKYQHWLDVTLVMVAARRRLFCTNVWHLSWPRPSTNASRFLRGSSRLVLLVTVKARSSDPCNSCHGRGRKQKVKTLNVKIPAWCWYWRPYSSIWRRWSGRARCSSWRPIRTSSRKRHNIFRRDGNNLLRSTSKLLYLSCSRWWSWSSNTGWSCKP